MNGEYTAQVCADAFMSEQAQHASNSHISNQADARLRLSPSGKGTFANLRKARPSLSIVGAELGMVMVLYLGIGIELLLWVSALSNNELSNF